MTTTEAERAGRRWTKDEDRAIEWNWGSLSVFDIAKKLGRTPHAIQQRAQKVLEMGPASRGTWSVRALSRHSGFSEAKVENAIQKLGMHVTWALRTDPRNKNKKIKRRAITEEQAEDLIQYMLEQPYVWTDAPGASRSTKGAWGVGKKPACCVKCGSAERRHVAKGLCLRCYQGKFRRTQAEKKKPVANALVPAQIVEIRNRRFRGTSYDKLAADFGVSRQAIAAITKGRSYKDLEGPIEPYENKTTS
jgi:biotin operon repressor